MYLLDTCAILWLAIDQEQFSPPQQQAVLDSGADLFFSSISALEIARLEKLQQIKIPIPALRWISKVAESEKVPVPLRIPALRQVPPKRLAETRERAPWGRLKFATKKRIVVLRHKLRLLRRRLLGAIRD